MSFRTLNFKWYDGFFLSMLVISVIVVAINWGKYHFCTYPLHIWIMVDYAVVFIFRVLMFVDNGLAAGLGPNVDQWERTFRFYGRIIVLLCLSILLYPFLWVWTIIGSLWFTSARTCTPPCLVIKHILGFHVCETFGLPEQGQKWGFIVWLLFSYCGLICIACISIGKWLAGHQAYLQRSQQRSPTSEFEVLVDLLRVPEWRTQTTTSSQEIRGTGHEFPSYHPSLHLSQAQREAIEALIQQLPKFCLKVVPSECNECPICLEEFHLGNEVRGLPCAHNFHVACIDQWLRLDIRCPRCRCCVFPNLDLSALVDNSNPNSHPYPHPQQPLIAPNSNGGAIWGPTGVPSRRYVRARLSGGDGQSNLVRLQEILRTIQMENIGPPLHSESRVDELRSVENNLESSYRPTLVEVSSANNAHSTIDPMGFDPLSSRSPPARF